jgi:hypothetical protein
MHADFPECNCDSIGFGSPNATTRRIGHPEGQAGPTGLQSYRSPLHGSLNGWPLPITHTKDFKTGDIQQISSKIVGPLGWHDLKREAKWEV